MIEVITVITGSDWSCTKNNKIKRKNMEFIVQNTQEETVDVNNTGDINQEIGINPYEYFDVLSSTYGSFDNISPVNLGLYLDKNLNIYSTQYVGVVPLTDSKSRPLVHDDHVYVIKINSRFHISPLEMLKEVLNGDDYYENPGMLQCSSYKLSELKEIFKRGRKNKVLCGTIKDIGKITLKQGEEVNGKDNELDFILSGIYPVFEVIRFVALAKEVCKKNLKQQSICKEENLVGKVKGRVLINKQIKQNLCRGQYHKTYCAYNFLSDNIKENVILKYTLHLCSKLEIADSLREDIMFCNRVLSKVPLKKCNINDFVGLKSNGVFRQYKQAMDAAKVIIRRYYISYDQSCENGNDINGKIKVADYSVEPYFIDMNLLFEYYCRALFRRAINTYNQKNNEYILQIEPITGENKKLFEDGTDISKFYMKEYIPDILVKYRKKNETEYKVLTVIDAKYSDVELSGEKRARTHQILFYMNILDSNYGGLISPNTNDQNSYLADNYLYDNKNTSRQKLCYLPLNKENDMPYDEMVYNYLEEIIKDRIQLDEDQQRQQELESTIKRMVNILSQASADENTKTLSITKKNIKNELYEFYKEYEGKFGDDKKNIQGE